MTYILQPEKLKDVFRRYYGIQELSPTVIADIEASNGNSHEWVATEKIRGSCVSILCDPDGNLAIGGKYGFADESFYGCAGDVVSIHYKKIIEFCRSEKVKVQIYGVLFGGFFNFKHPAGNPTKFGIPMDSMVIYSPQNHWWIHDISINGIFVGWDRVKELARMLEMKTVPVIRSGKMEDILKLTPDKKISAISLMLHEISLENNLIGGIVFRPIVHNKTFKGERMIFKLVREIFKKITNQKTVDTPELNLMEKAMGNETTEDIKTEDAKAEVLLSHLFDKYVNLNRINSIFAKNGKPIEERQLGEYLCKLGKGLFIDAGADGYDKPVIKRLNNAATWLFKSNFYEILATIYIANAEPLSEQSRHALEKYEEVKRDSDKIKVVDGKDFVLISIETDTKPEETKPVTTESTETEPTTTESTVTKPTTTSGTNASAASNNYAANNYAANNYNRGYSTYNYNNTPDTTINFIACPDIAEIDLIVPSYKERKSPGFGFFSIEQNIINPGETKFVRTGWRCSIEKGYHMHFEPRSALDTLEDVHVLTKPNVVTESFEDELRIVIWNDGKKPIEIPKNTMMVYGILSKSEPVKVDVVKEETEKISIL